MASDEESEHLTVMGDAMVDEAGDMYLEVVVHTMVGMARLGNRTTAEIAQGTSTSRTSNNDDGHLDDATLNSMTPSQR